MTLPTTPRICCCTTSRNLSVQICCIFCILNCVSMKGSHQTHGGNFITSQKNSQLIIKISWTVLWVCDVSYWLGTRSLTTSEVHIFFSVGNLWFAATCESVDCVSVSELSAACQCYFLPIVSLEIHLLTLKCKNSGVDVFISSRHR